MSNKMWGGRFASGPAEIMEEINASIAFDQKLFAQDIAGSKAHARMLAKQAIISKADAKAILKGLDQVEGEIKSGKFKFSRALEDIHMNVESRLKDLIGAPAGRLHTGRSRNDQVAVDFRLYVRDAADHLQEAVRELQRVLVKQASAHSASIMPGFTHLQTAQPITFGHHLLAYVEMLERDYGRFADARARMNESPLGAAALAGTVYPIDRKMTASELGFARPMRNSLDAVSDRDFALEMLAASSICAIHLSRLAEEIVLWMTAQFGFVKLSDQFTTGSSIMPQKRNPDAAELIRAKPGRILGSFVALAGVMKGLPLTYSKDMQEDKEPVFDALSNLSLAIAAMTGMIKDMKPDLARMRQAAERGFANATDLADWLVQKLGLPFREAHHVTGALVALAEQKGTGLEGLSLADMQKIHKAIHADVFKAITIEASVNARKSYGGTAPAQVRKQVEFWRKKLSSGTKLGYKK